MKKIYLPTSPSIGDTNLRNLVQDRFLSKKNIINTLIPLKRKFIHAADIVRDFKNRDLLHSLSESDKLNIPSSTFLYPSKNVGDIDLTDCAHNKYSTHTCNFINEFLKNKFGIVDEKNLNLLGLLKVDNLSTSNYQNLSIKFSTLYSMTEKLWDPTPKNPILINKKLSVILRYLKYLQHLLLKNNYLLQITTELVSYVQIEKDLYILNFIVSLIPIYPVVNLNSKHFVGVKSGNDFVEDSIFSTKDLQILTKKEFLDKLRDFFNQLEAHKLKKLGSLRCANIAGTKLPTMFSSRKNSISHYQGKIPERVVLEQKIVHIASYFSAFLIDSAKNYKTSAKVGIMELFEKYYATGEENFATIVENLIFLCRPYLYPNTITPEIITSCTSLQRFLCDEAFGRFISD